VGIFTYAFGFVVGSYSRSETWQGASSRQLCRPFRDDGTLDCGQAAVGPPTKSMASVATLEMRKFTKNIAINPYVQRGFEKKVTAVAVPIYFLKSGEGLAGGERGHQEEGERPGWNGTKASGLHGCPFRRRSDRGRHPLRHARVLDLSHAVPISSPSVNGAADRRFETHRKSAWRSDRSSE